MRRLLCTLCLLIGMAAATAQPLPVAPGVFVQRDRFDPGRQPDGNSVLFVAPQGVVLVDSGRHIAHTQALIDFAAARKAPILALVNTHWHLDHLGGNALLRSAVPVLQVVGSTAIAPALGGWLADSRRDMRAMLDAGGQDAATEAMLRVDIALIDQGERLRPDLALDGPRTLTYGGLALQVGHEARAVTAGDLWVYEPRSAVLAVGDLVTLPVPFLDTACPAGWRRALAHVEAVPFTTLVPGHGAPMSRADFGRWRAAFDGLLDCAAGSDTPAACTDGWLAALGPLLPAAEQPRARAMLGYYLQQHLRAPAERRDRTC